MTDKKASRFVWVDDDIEMVEKKGVKKDTEESEMLDSDAIRPSLSGQSIPSESTPENHPQDSTGHQSK